MASELAEAAREHVLVLRYLDRLLAEELARPRGVYAELRARFDVIRNWTPAVVTPPLAKTAAAGLRFEIDTVPEPLRTRLNVAAKGLTKGVHRREGA